MGRQEFESIKALVGKELVDRMKNMTRVEAIRFFAENVKVGTFSFKLKIIKEFIDQLQKE